MIRLLTIATTLGATLALLPGSADAEINEDLPGDDGGDGGGGGEPPPPPPPGYWQKLYNKGDYAGTSGWGAGYNVTGKLSATPKSDTVPRDKLEARASARAYAKLNSSSYTLFEVRAVGLTEAQARTQASVNAFVVGANVWSESWESANSTYTFLAPTPIDWPATFVDRRVNVWVGPVPVSFRVAATGRLTANLTGKISNVGVELASTPTGRASLYASAAIGGVYCLWEVCVGAEAGVYADVDLIRAQAPAIAKLWWSLAPRTPGILLNYKLDADLQLTELDGELGAFARAVSPIFDKYWEETFVDWDGFAQTFSLIDVAGSHCLTGFCGLVL